MTVVDIEPDGTGGWLIEWVHEDNMEGAVAAVFHLTDQTLADLSTVLDVNRSDRVAWNWLAYELRNGDPIEIAARFADCYGQIVGSRIARHRLGLKAVTRDGDEDLKAVQAGEPVRPWNATRPVGPLADYAKRRHGEGKPNGETPRGFKGQSGTGSRPS